MPEQENPFGDIKHSKSVDQRLRRKAETIESLRRAAAVNRAAMESGKELWNVFGPDSKEPIESLIIRFKDGKKVQRRKIYVTSYETGKYVSAVDAETLEEIGNIPIENILMAE